MCVGAGGSCLSEVQSVRSLVLQTGLRGMGRQQMVSWGSSKRHRGTVPWLVQGYESLELLFEGRERAHQYLHGFQAYSPVSENSSLLHFQCVSRRVSACADYLFPVMQSCLSLPSGHVAADCPKQ